MKRNVMAFENVFNEIELGFRDVAPKRHEHDIEEAEHQPEIQIGHAAFRRIPEHRVGDRIGQEARLQQGRSRDPEFRIGCPEIAIVEKCDFRRDPRGQSLAEQGRDRFIGGAFLFGRPRPLDFVLNSFLDRGGDILERRFLGNRGACA